MEAVHVYNLFAEFRIAASSRWTRSLAVIALTMIAFSFWSLYGQISSIDAGFGPLRQAGAFKDGQSFKTWVSESPDQEDVRTAATLVAPGMGVNHSIGVIGSLGPLLCIIWGASMVGGELTLRTARLRAANAGWDRVIVAKLAVIAVAVAAAVVVAVLLGAAAQPILTAAVTHRFSWVMAVAAPHSPAVLPQMMAVLAGCVMFALLGVVLALLFRSTTVAVLLGLFLTLFVQAPLGWWWLPENAYSALLSQVISYPAGGLIGASPSLPKSPPPFAFYPVLVVVAWSLALYVATILIARSQDVR